MLATSAAAQDPGRLVLESGPGSAGGLAWRALHVEVVPGGDGTVSWTGRVEGLDGPAALGRIEVSCAVGRLVAGRPVCPDGRFEWHPPEGTALTGAFSLDAGETADWHLTLRPGGEAAAGSVDIAFPESGLAVRIEDLDLGALPSALAAAGGLVFLEGRVEHLTYAHDADGVRLDAAISGLGWDNPDGTLAGAGVDARIEARMTGDGPRDFELRLVQSAGEILLGPLYLPSPSAPVELAADGRVAVDGAFRLEDFRLDDPDTLTMRGGATGHLAGGGPVVESLAVEHLEATLPAAQDRYAGGLLDRFGLGGLATAGRVTGSGRWADGSLAVLDLDLEALAVDDGAGRFSIDRLRGGLAWRAAEDRLDADLAWDAAGLYALQLGGAALELATTGGDLALEAPLVLPLYDGRVVLETFEWTDWRGESARLDLDARIEPVSLNRLSLALGWPELGGTLAGGVRDVSYGDGVLAFGGGIDIRAFSGSIRIDDLSVERPFGTLPVLAADVRFDGLDLLEVTGAFGFGRMEGRLDGHVQDLRMLDWQPVAFDADLHTVEDAERRRISQRAVDNLSSLGGAGGAALSGTLLRMFEDFGYARAGLTCRLSNNICRMGGVADTEGGGYLIVEGRGLPHLDVVGFRRLVDWPRLLAQLRAATAGQ